MKQRTPFPHSPCLLSLRLQRCSMTPWDAVRTPALRCGGAGWSCTVRPPRSSPSLLCLRLHRCSMKCRVAGGTHALRCVGPAEARCCRTAVSHATSASRCQASGPGRDSCTKVRRASQRSYGGLARPCLLCLRPKPRVAGSTHALRCVGSASEASGPFCNGGGDDSISSNS